MLLGELILQQGEVIFVKVQHSLLAQQAQLMGEGAAVDAEKAGHFVPGEGDGKGEGVS